VIPGRRRPPSVRAPRDPGKPARATDKRTRGHGRRGGSGYADRPPGSPALRPLPRRPAPRHLAP